MKKQELIAKVEELTLMIYKELLQIHDSGINDTDIEENVLGDAGLITDMLKEMLSENKRGMLEFN